MSENVLPWGAKLLLMYEVPSIIPCTNKITILRNSRTGKPFAKRDSKADNFTGLIHSATLRLIEKLKKEHEFLNDVRFPLAGAECQLRIDVLLAFNAAGKGQSRLKQADIDNLKKGIFDGLEGALIDNDRFITEGYTAKGTAPDNCEVDMIVLGVSRAGFRSWPELYSLAGMPVFSPWRPQDRSPIIQVGQKIIH